MSDLRTQYVGLDLANPVIAAPCPLSRTVEGVRRLANAGVGAIVLYSLFEEQIRRDDEEHLRLTSAGTDSFAESLSYFPRSIADDPGPSRHLRLLEQTTSLGLPIIASLNGATAGGWTRYARMLEEAGAAAIELNLYAYPAEGVADRQHRYVDILGSVKSVVSVPVAVKFGPSFDSVTATALQFDAAGADALVLVNRFPQLDVDLETLVVTRHVELSTPGEARPVRNWISWLHGQVGADLAATTGVESADDVLRYLLAGADVVMTASSLLRHGPEYAGELLAGLESWMDRKGFATVAEFRGIAAESTRSARDDGRAGYFAAMWSANASLSIH